MRPLALDPDAIAGLIHGGLEDGAGAWNMGVEGALAEFAIVDGERTEVRRGGPGGRTVEAVTAGGAIRLTITDDTVAYTAGPGSGITLAVPRSTLPAPRPRVTALPADPAAVGHSVAAFCVRTADPDVIAALRAVEGNTWRAALDCVGHLLVAASPHRVVTGPLGRIEVYNPIPKEWGASPEGCHTHLLPALLETGRETAEGDELPPHLAAAVNWSNPTR